MHKNLPLDTACSNTQLVFDQASPSSLNVDMRLGLRKNPTFDPWSRRLWSFMVGLKGLRLVGSLDVGTPEENAMASAIREL